MGRFCLTLAVVLALMLAAQPADAYRRRYSSRRRSFVAFSARRRFVGSFSARRRAFTSFSLRRRRAFSSRRRRYVAPLRRRRFSGTVSFGASAYTRRRRPKWGGVSTAPGQAGAVSVWEERSGEVRC